MCGDLGRGVRGNRTAAACDPGRARARCGGGVSRQSERAPFLADGLCAAAAARHRYTQPVQCVLGRPVAAPARELADVRAPVAAADSRSRPARRVADARCQSGRLERQPDDGTGCDGATQGDPRARGLDRGRSASQRNRGDREHASVDPPGRRCLVPDRVVAGVDASRCAAARRVCGQAQRFRWGDGTRAGGADRRSAAAHGRHDGAGRRRRRAVAWRHERLRVRTHGRIDAALRYRRAVSDPVDESLPRPTRSRRRLLAERGHRAGDWSGDLERLARTLGVARARLAGSQRRIAGGGVARGDRNARCRAGARAADRGRQSGGVDTERRGT